MVSSVLFLFFKLFLKFKKIFICLLILAGPYNMWDLSSPTRELNLYPLHWKCRVLTQEVPETPRKSRSLLWPDTAAHQKPSRLQHSKLCGTWMWPRGVWFPLSFVFLTWILAQPGWGSWSRCLKLQQLNKCDHPPPPSLENEKDMS